MRQGLIVLRYYECVTRYSYLLSENYIIIATCTFNLQNFAIVFFGREIHV